MRVLVMTMLVGCGGLTSVTDAELPGPDGHAEGTVRFDVDGGFWDAPFPSDHRVDEDTRRVDLTGFPNPGAVPLVDTLTGMLDGAVQGWARSGAIYVPVGVPLGDRVLVDAVGSVASGSPVFLMDVDPDSEDLGRRYPIDVLARDSASAFGPEHAVVALPLQGVPLPPRRRYALVVTSAVTSAEGQPLRAPPAIAALREGEAPEGWRADVADQYVDAVATLEAQAVPLQDIAGLSVFTTGRPTRDLDPLMVAARANGGLQLSRSPSLLETYDDYCVYEGRFSVPVFQEGTSPYLTEGGGFVFDDEGLPVLQGRAQGRIFVTVPRDGSLRGPRPTAVFIRTGGGGDRPLIDRGPRSTPGVDVPGTGYAATLARQGWAGIQVDGPLGGLRNPEDDDEQFLLFNINNPVALRDNLRQSALELALLPDIVSRLLIPGAGCEGIEGLNIRFDGDHLVLFGHSMGATIAPLVAAAESRYRGVVLSGAGGSWIENVLHKERPLEVRPLAATMLGESPDDFDGYHPVLTLLQWAGEPADPPLYARRLLSKPPEEVPHILMIQGLVDHYILPPIANAASLSLQLDLAGTPLDASYAPTYRALEPLLPLVGARTRPLPTGVNRPVGERFVTGVVVQLPEDGIEDGHEVAFQDPWGRYLLDCFLDGVLVDAPMVVGQGYEGDDCPLAPEAP